MFDRDNLLQNAAIRAGLPGESVPGTTLVEVFGTSRVLIERHCGVTGYSDLEICVRGIKNIIFIEGSGLKIACMSKQQLIITGCISSVRFLKRG